MRYLIVFLLAVTSVYAQKSSAYKQGPIRPQTSGAYRNFGIAHIPKHCKHARLLYGEKVCRAYARFDRPVPGNLVFFTEDWSNKEDSTYHVRLLAPTQFGIYIEAIPGHDIWWQVNSR